MNLTTKHKLVYLEANEGVELVRLIDQLREVHEIVNIHTHVNVSTTDNKIIEVHSAYVSLIPNIIREED